MYWLRIGGEGWSTSGNPEYIKCTGGVGWSLSGNPGYIIL